MFNIKIFFFFFLKTLPLTFLLCIFQWIRLTPLVALTQTCHLFKVFPFGNLRELLQCFSFARLKRTIFWRFKYVILRNCNTSVSGKWKCVVLGRLKCVILRKLKCVIFERFKYLIFRILKYLKSWDIEMYRAREIEMFHFRETEMRHSREIEICHFWDITILQFSGA